MNRRWSIASAVIVSTLVAGVSCTSKGPGNGPVGASATPSPSPAATQAPLQPVARRCGSPNVQADTFWFQASDGTWLDGATLGTGSVGVVLAHEYPADLCGWWPYAVYLSRHGLRILLFDFRCFGASTCPGGGSLLSDVEGAVRVLRADDVRDVFLLGGSLGGTVVMMAGVEITPRVEGVVSLSGEADLGFLVGDVALNARSAVGDLRSPFLEIVARGDRSISIEDARDLYDRAGSRDKRLIVLPARFGHGWNIVTATTRSPTRVAETVLRFIQARA